MYIQRRFPRGSVVKNPPANVGDGGSIPGQEAVFLPGESHGQSSLVGYSPWGHKESDTTDVSHIPAAPATCSLLRYQRPAPRVMFGEPTWKNSNHQNLSFTVGFILTVVHPMDFDTYIITFISHYNCVNYFHCPKNSLCSTYSSPQMILILLCL